MATPQETTAALVPPVHNHGVRQNSFAGFSVNEPAAANRSMPGASIPKVALLTAAWDKPYALGLASALVANGQIIDFLGGDAVDSPELHGNPQLNYLNLRRQSADAGLFGKMTRMADYYRRLTAYAATSRAPLFHILWNNKFELFDRTLLMLYYKLLGKKIVFTAHNVNTAARDGYDSFLNRFSLRVQYRLSDHIFVHTKTMKSELVSDFAVRPDKVTVIPFGINNTVPNTALTRAEARDRIGIGADEQALLFFGNIAPYKGLEYLVEAFISLSKKSPRLRLIIAGRTKGGDNYWNRIEKIISSSGVADRITQRIEYVPDEQTELYFKAADVLILPYTQIFQSGVLFLGYSFGLPVVVADVGSLKEEVIEGQTGFVFPPKDSSALANAIEKYFSSELYKELESRRQKIRQYANEQHSWAEVAAITRTVYSAVLESVMPQVS